jgi:hypothetical protein
LRLNDVFREAIVTIGRFRAEPIAFWLIATLHLIPVWSHRYLPTQDGPSHVNNAQILKNFHDPETGYDRIFEIRFDPLPNLSSHLLLAALMYVAPPLVAEKLLVSLYVLGFAGGFRYFLGAFGPTTRPLSWASLLFVFNRCFWMGFYNYCLSLALVWVILGYVLRRLGTMHAGQAFVLMILLVAAYFTHLAGFMVALAGTFLAAILVSPRRIGSMGLVVLAALPSICLTMNYLEETGFSRSPAAMRIVNDPLNRLEGNLREAEMEKDLFALADEVFTYHAGSTVPLAMIFGGYLLVLTMFTIAIPPNRPPGSGAGPGPLFPAVFGVLLLAAYLLVPDHLGGGDGGLPNGGFLKARLAPLPPLLWLACLREPTIGVVRYLFRVGIVILLGANLWLVSATVENDNRVLEQHTAGLESIGRGHRLIAVQSAGWRSPLANPLTHAPDYYCLGTGNTNLDNYEARMPHFPVTYRPEFDHGHAIWTAGDRSNRVDTVVCWQAGGPPAGWDMIFNHGPLRIFRRPEGNEKNP